MPFLSHRIGPQYHHALSLASNRPPIPPLFVLYSQRTSHEDDRNLTVSHPAIFPSTLDLPLSPLREGIFPTLDLRHVFAFFIAYSIAFLDEAIPTSTQNGALY